MKTEIYIGDKVSIAESFKHYYDWRGYESAEVVGLYGCEAVLRLPSGLETTAFIDDLVKA